MEKFYENTTENSLKSSLHKLILPQECANRTQKDQVPEYIVLHEPSTGLYKTPPSFNMQYYARKILIDGLQGKEVGYHFFVGDKKVYQFIPEDEVAYHTGTSFNYKSIGVERLVCMGISHEDALHNQAKLVATLMVKWGLGIDKVITHLETRRRSLIKPRVCPSRLLAGLYGGLPGFMQEISYCLKTRDLFFELFESTKLIDDLFKLKLKPEEDFVRIRGK